MKYYIIAVRDHHQQGLAKVLVNAFKIMTWEAYPYYNDTIWEGLMDAPKVIVVIVQHMQPWFIRSLENDDVEFRIIM